MKRDTYIDDINGNRLFEGDRVKYQVRRVSSSWGSWGQVRNKNHGFFEIPGTIAWYEGRFIIKANEEEYEALKKPKGHEQFKQNVWFEQVNLFEACGVEKVYEEN